MSHISTAEPVAPSFRFGAGLLRIGTAALAGALVCFTSAAAAAPKAVNTAGDSIVTVADQLNAAPGGTQIGPNEVAYDGGKVIVTLPSTDGAKGPSAVARNQSTAARAGDVEGCPAGNPDNRWYCLYEHKDFKGRRVQWNYRHCSDDPIYLVNYGFKNVASSWVNTSAMVVAARAYTGDGAGGSVQIWTEKPNTRSSYVGNANNDRADILRAC